MEIDSRCLGLIFGKIKTAVNNILVSHRIKDRARGKLHEETMYGHITLLMVKNLMLFVND